MATFSTETEPTFRDYYEALNLQPQADAAMVDQAYWHLARLYNGAIASDGSARAKLDELNEAYSVLRSPALRREYDKLRDAVMGEGALPQAVATVEEPEPLPLAVMEKQRPKPRQEPKAENSKKRAKKPKQKKPKEPKQRRAPHLRLHIRRIRIPSWQGVVTALVVLTLGSTALVDGADVAMVLPLMIVGSAFAVIPLLREIPRLPAPPVPALRLPSVRAPHLPERSRASAVDPDTLRQSTEAMLARWRVGTESVEQGSMDVPLPPNPGEGPFGSPSDEDDPAGA